MNKLPKIYIDLMNIAGISGYEKNVCSYMQKNMEKKLSFGNTLKLIRFLIQDKK